MKNKIRRKLTTLLDRFLSWISGMGFLPCPICGESFGWSEKWLGTWWRTWYEGHKVCFYCVDEANRRNAENQEERDRQSMEWHIKMFPSVYGKKDSKP